MRKVLLGLLASVLFTSTALATEGIQSTTSSAIDVVSNNVTVEVEHNIEMVVYLSTSTIVFKPFETELKEVLEISVETNSSYSIDMASSGLNYLSVKNSLNDNYIPLSEDFKTIHTGLGSEVTKYDLAVNKNTRAAKESGELEIKVYNIAE